MNGFLMIKGYKLVFTHYLLIESYNFVILDMILLIFYEIMYVFLKKQILYR
jgi:hypothetical protein